MLPNLTQDLRRYLRNGKLTWKQFFYVLFAFEPWVIVVYRFGSWVHYHVHVPIIRVILKIIAYCVHRFMELLTGVCIPLSVCIGEGLYIGHYGRIIINGKVKIGKNFSVGPDVIIGSKGFGQQGVPEIGDDVFVGAGAKVLGGVNIGNHVKIGANAVVVNDIPDYATVVGIPAKVVKTKHKEE